MAAGRRAAVLLLLVLLAGGLLLSAAPGDPGALRLRGVGLLWWYAALVAPLVALAVAVPVLAAPSAGPTPSVAFWVSPVVPAAVAARVFDGAAEAPVVVLAAAVAPLLALLVARAPAAPPGVAARLATAAGAALVLGAGLSVLAEAGVLLGLPRAAVVAGALAGAAVPALAPRAPAAGARQLALGLGTLGVVASVAAVGLGAGAAPWAAWRDVASRPALTFDARSPAVVAGRVIGSPTTLAFGEAHRVTALRPGVYRVTDGARPHEWRLRSGDTLELRPGDRLALDAGAHVRFEAGKRVPTAPASGVAWADPPGRASWGTAARTTGVALTLLGGALALVPPAGARGAARAAGGAGLVVGLVLAAACLGVFGVRAAPELAIGAAPLAAPLELPALVLGARWGRAWAVAGVLALVLLLAAAAGALAGPATGAARRRGGLALRLGVLAGAAATGLWPGGDPWRTGLLGLGLAASAGVAPRLGGGGPRAALAGTLAGALVFAALAVAAPWLPAWAQALGAYPALAAAPLGWAASRGGRVAAAEQG